MGIGTGLGIAGIVSAGVGAAGAIKASDTQASAAKSAAETQAQESQNALNVQQQEFNTQQQNEAPFLQAGQGAVGQLSSMLQPGGSLTQSYPGGTFTAPTAAQAAAQPGYQFQLQQGENALQNSAAASGGLLNGQTAEGLNNYAQNAAQTDYQNVYSNALNSYNTNFNAWNTQQGNQFNRLASLAGLGQTTAGQLGQQGQAAASNTANIDLTTGQQQGNALQNAAYQQASGYANVANSVNGGLNSLSQTALLSQLLNNQAYQNSPSTLASEFGGTPSILQPGGLANNFSG